MAEVEVEVGPRGVATVWLNRPERHNAYDGALIDGLIAAAERAAVDDAIRVVVLRGRGPSFQAGADLGWLKTMAAADAATNLDFSRRWARRASCAGAARRRSSTPGAWSSCPA
jgi:methylglutaconyl-CoA hydratase